MYILFLLSFRAGTLAEQHREQTVIAIYRDRFIFQTFEHFVCPHPRESINAVLTTYALPNPDSVASKSYH